VNLEANNAHAVNGMDAQELEVGGMDPYLVSAVNDVNDPGRKRLSESMSVALDELGDATISRRATLLRMAGKN